MFGILCIDQSARRTWSARLRPSGLRKGWLSVQSGYYHMAMYTTVRVDCPEDLPARTVQKRIDYALRLLQKQGVHRLIAPRALWPQLGNYTMAPVSQRPLLEALVVQLCAAAFGHFGLDEGQSCVTVCAERLRRDAYNGILSLARRVRSIRLQLRHPAPDLQARLLHEYGICCAEQLPQHMPNLCLLLDGTSPEGCDYVLNATGEDCDCAPAQRLFVPHLCLSGAGLQKVPDGVCAGDFAAALYVAGGVAPSEVLVKTGQNSALTECPANHIIGKSVLTNV